MAFADPGSGRTVHPVSANDQIQVTLAGTVKIGDLIGFSTGWKRADANAPINPRFIALQNGISGEVIAVCASAQVDGFTGGTAGGKVYASATAGSYSDAASGGGGDYNTAIGCMLTATTAFISLDVTA